MNPLLNKVEPGEHLIPTHCCYCGMQCAMYLRVNNESGKVVGVEPRYDFPVNKGKLCPKGVTAYQTIHHPDRLTTPLIRRNGRLEPASWDEALDLVASKMRAIQGEHGKDAFAVFGGVSMTNEKCYLAGKFARVALGTANIDYNGRFCMAAAAAGAIKTFGIDRGLFNPWSDILLADAILISGSNTSECHPTSIQYFWQARDRGAKLIVIDPRETPIARVADIHLAPRPGTDSALLNGILHVVIEEGYTDEGFIARRTHGYEELKRVVAAYPPERVAAITGVPAGKIVQAARIFGRAATGMAFYARGIEQHSKGVENVMQHLNLLLITGKIGKPGCGGGTLTGQGNGQGGREHGQKADQLPGYRLITDPAARKHVAGVWGIDEAELPGKGLSAYELLAAIERREVRGLYVLCSNPAVSAPNANLVNRGLEGLDFLVVADFFLSETAQLADVVLPTTVWAEDEGTTTNAEGRVIKINKAAEPPAGVLTDWQILAKLADRLGRGEYFRYQKPAEIFEEFRRASQGGTADYYGITYERIERENGVFWPCPTPESPGVPRMFEERFHHPDGRAVMHAIEFRPAGETPDEEFPLILTTGRVVYHYLSGNQTRRVGFLMEQCPEPFLEIHPVTAAQVGAVDGMPIRVVTRRGEMVLKARVVKTIRPDTLFIPYHWGEALAANLLTNPELDPICRMPEFKACAAAVTPVGATTPRPGASDRIPALTAVGGN
ncbi:MAG: formate dehydrogenase subunit alpha [Bacillota bacterium]